MEVVALFGPLGLPEMLIILAIVILIFGANRLPELGKGSFEGATGRIEFDAKGDRKDAEMTIFTMRAGRIIPVAVVKGDKTIDYRAFLNSVR